MAEARGRFEWNQTSSVIAVIAGIMHDKKHGKPPTPSDFNPYEQRKRKNKRNVQKAPITVLRDLFCKGN